MTPLRPFRVGPLEAQVHGSAEEAGQAMAAAVARQLRELAAQPEINIAFACTPSLDTFFDALVLEAEVPWNRIRAFHLGEYLGLPPGHPSSSAAYLDDHLLSRVPLLAFHPLYRDGGDASDAAEAYAELLRRHPLALACISIGENGQLAFNNPNVADPHDPVLVKPTSLDLTSRRQQVFEGAFPRVEDVPTEALTLTLTSILSADAIHAVAYGDRYAAVVRAALNDAIGMACPATALRMHARATLYLDPASASKLQT